MKVIFSLIPSLVIRRSFWLLVLGIVLYNLNKYYLRFLSMENALFRILTDVWPNAIIVFIFFLVLVLMRPNTMTATDTRRLYYGGLFLFCLVLGVEEYTGVFRMSRVTDLNDGLASCISAGVLVMACEVKGFLGKKINLQLLKI